MAELSQPARIHWINGSQDEYDSSATSWSLPAPSSRSTTRSGPAAFTLAPSPTDVARVEDRTFICSLSKDNAGPTNNWEDPFVMRKQLKQLFTRLHARPHHVCACLLHGPGWLAHLADRRRNHRFRLCGRQHAHYVAHRPAVLAEIDKDINRVTPCMHTVGAPLEPGQKDVPWPCNDKKYIVHFPETREIWSYGSGYGGNALLGKKCFALRIASNIARDEGWMAEHMLIVGIETPPTPTVAPRRLI